MSIKRPKQKIKVKLQPGVEVLANEVVERTRRQWRKGRNTLKSGQVGLKGKVVKFFPDKELGYIAPEGGAAHIVFYSLDVPWERSKCVGVGRTVYFDVVESGKVVRSDHSRPRLVALVRSHRPI